MVCASGPIFSLHLLQSSEYPPYIIFLMIWLPRWWAIAIALKMALYISEQNYEMYDVDYTALMDFAIPLSALLWLRGLRWWLLKHSGEEAKSFS